MPRAFFILSVSSASLKNFRSFLSIFFIGTERFRRIGLSTPCTSFKIAMRWDFTAQQNVRQEKCSLLALPQPFDLRLYESVEVAVEDFTCLRRLTVCSVVFHHRIRMQNIGADLIAPRDRGFSAFYFFELFDAFFFFKMHYFGI